MKEENNNIIDVIVEGMQDIKAKSITTVDLHDIESSGVAAFVICQGTSSQHVASIADRMQDYVLKHASRKAINTCGEKNCEWIIVDYGDVMAHIFIPEARDRYALEQLWSDAVIKNIPDLD